MSKLHDMKLQYQGDPLMFKRKKPVGDIDFSKNPLDEFEQQLKKKYGR
jgi:hypothetical protein